MLDKLLHMIVDLPPMRIEDLPEAIGLRRKSDRAKLWGGTS